ncbi:DUF4279 domain-containing protein [Snodgrassella alvi]|jgi:hypothetical protein|uniref:DUF4279 domain-containing protein n=1 Tax=Snodgrassella alvi TaxID=1196083 RepID=A0A855G118_9NEIS|nr:DUF4279 domain-containing protein [Snodgrassella alvi]PIT09029.1 hypothetical protein BGI30_07770 [Snodgrassella alvi]PIT59489.1 hypothetical protein BHC59_00565 [Snodgrassella alvi]PIT60341.1 hypothetical protein BHC57_04295 [Snodgrassella alvi]
MEQTTVMVEFAMCGEEFNPDEVTKLLGILPTKTRIKGSMTDAQYHPAIETTWSLRNYENSINDLDQQLCQIINGLKDKTEILLKLKKEYNLYYMFIIVAYIYNDIESDIYLKRNTLDFISLLDAKLTIEIDTDTDTDTDIY